MDLRQAALLPRSDFVVLRRLQDYVGRGLLAAAISIFGAAIAFITMIERESIMVMGAWLVAMLALNAVRVVQTREFEQSTIDPEYLKRQYYLIHALLVADTVLWVCGLGLLIPGANATQLFVLCTLVLGGLVAAMVYMRPLPLAAAGFAFAMATAGIYLAPQATGFANYIPEAIILTYLVIVLRGIHDNETSYSAKLARELAMIDHEETIQLLLHGYDSQSADWLWHIDAQGKLADVSERFGEAAGRDPAELENTHFPDLFVEGTQAELLAHRLMVRQPFREITLELDVQGERRWWTLSANRLEDGTMRGVARDTTETRQALARVDYMAHHDNLTGIANRFLFGETLAENLDRQLAHERLALLYLDVDHFKIVNDTLGHSVGDVLLTEVAWRLRAIVKGHDLCARLGGDEFAILLTRLERPEEATLVAERIVAALRQPFEINGQRVQVGTSVGIAHFKGTGGNADDLLHQADLALYSAKAMGRGCYAEFEPWLEERDRERAALEADLRHAIEGNQFTLHYQPIFDIAGKRTIGFETLVRWDHPSLRVVMPGDFIPLAEESGLIVPLGEWIIHNAILEAASWPDKESVAINLSPLQMRSPRLLPTLLGAIEESGIDPQRIDLEITESVLMQDSDANVANLHKFRELGMRISLDDFGTGYSSLSYLRSFPFDKIKIDKSFVEDIEFREDCQAIVRTVIDLADALGMDTVAEGIERESQLDWLREHGCKQVQGYLISYPVNRVELSDGRPFGLRDANWFRPQGKPISDAA